jgi:hypothetical protein
MINKKQTMKKRTKVGLLYTGFFIFLVGVTSFYVIRWAKGDYRKTPTEGKIVKETGLLNANSFPEGAQVFVNDKLVTATNNIVYLEPGEYDVMIKKEGFHDWKKKIKIEKSLVKQTNSLLFPIAPSLLNLTFSGLDNLRISPNGQKLVYHIASSSVKLKNGLYVLDISNNWQSKRIPVQISDDIEGLAKANIIFSPDSSKLLIQVSEKYYLVEVSEKSELSSAPDIFFQKDTLLEEWEEEISFREKQILSKFPEEIIALATSSAKNLFFSPDETKMLYTATESIEIKKDLIPPVISANDQEESREIELNNIYVYDKKEDKNFLIGNETNFLESSSSARKKELLNTKILTTNLLVEESTSESGLKSLQNENFADTSRNFADYYSAVKLPTLQWMSDSQHLLGVENDQIFVKDYDGANMITLYSGPFKNNFVYPWPDGSKLIILTKFNPKSPVNLYAIELNH